MKVLMFGWEFPPEISGGLGTACYGLSRHLAQLDVEVVFVVPRMQAPPAIPRVDIVCADRVDTADVAVAPDILPLAAALRPYEGADSYRRRLATHRLWTDSGSVLAESDRYGGDLFGEIRRYAAVAGQLGATQRPAIVHAHDWMTFSAAAAAAAAADCPFVAHVHSTEPDRTGDNPDADIAEIERLGLESADRIIAVSGRTRDMLIERYGLDADRITVVYNAVAKAAARRRPRPRHRPLAEKVVLFFGRVTTQKGPDYFIDAARLVLQRMTNVRFVMAGAGDRLPRMIERIAGMGIQSHFHFTGFLRGADLEQMFAVSDLYVMPSVSEPFGIAPYEAMLHGVPVIVSRQSGIREVLDTVTAVDFWDVNALADAIVRILSTPGLAEDLVASGTRQVAAASWESSAAAVRAVYDELLHPRARRANDE